MATAATSESVRTVGPNAAKRAVARAIKVRRPVFLHGAPGIGKSDIVHSIGVAANRPIIDIRLALWDPTDLKGVLHFNPNLGTTAWSAPPELPSDPDSNAILFFDELNSAPPAVQAAAYQLILNRRCGTYVLPDGVDIVAAGNREGDRGVTYRIPAPLANRFIHLELKVDFEDWQEWALENQIHPEVVGYLSFAPNDLNTYKSTDNSKAFATPRTWKFLSDLVWDEGDIDNQTLHALVSGTIGDGVGTKFMSHRKVAGQLPKPGDILDGKVTQSKISDISAMYSLTVSMSYELKDRLANNVEGWHQMLDNFFTFMSNNFPVEVTIMGARSAIVVYKFDIAPSKLPNWDKFHTKYGKYFIKALTA